MTNHTPYEKVELAAAREEVEPEHIAFISLDNLPFSTLQSVAGDHGLYPDDHPDDVEIRRILAEAGFFYGDVGDDTLYRRLDGETVVIQEG